MDQVFFSVDDELDHMESLVDWLLNEPELRGCVTEQFRPPAGGEMGPIADVVAVAVGSGGALTVLATSLRTWLLQPRRSDVRIKVRGSNGKTVEIDAKRVADVEALVRAALESEGGERSDATA